jgi:hypothetical protein
VPLGIGAALGFVINVANMQARVLNILAAP